MSFQSKEAQPKVIMLLATAIDIPTLCGFIIPGFLLCYAVWTFAIWYRLRHIPGPFTASFSYLWVTKTVLRGQSLSAYTSLKKYGSMVRIGPNYVVADDPSVL